MFKCVFELPFQKRGLDKVINREIKGIINLSQQNFTVVLVIPSEALI